VLQRYIEIVSRRIEGLGGHPDAIPPSLSGAPIKHRGCCDDLVEIRGKVLEVVFDCFGDFEGLVLDDCCRHHLVKSREREIGTLAVRACHERLPLSVFVDHSMPPRIHRLVVRA
jgi:hypothetical protein